MSENVQSQNTTPRKSRTPQIAKTAPIPRAGLRAEMTQQESAAGLDQEIADELLQRIEQLEAENKKLRKIASKGKGATDALRTALGEAERQQRTAQLWMASGAMFKVQLNESAARQEELARQLAGEAERNERLLARTRSLEQLLARNTAHDEHVRRQALYFASVALKLQRTLEGSEASDEDLAALQAALDVTLAFVQ